MDIVFFLTPFITSFAIAIVIFWILTLFNFGHNNRKGIRHIHTRTVSRLGGIGIIAAFLITLYMDGRLVTSGQLIGMIIASVVILLLGIWDDFFELEWRVQLFFQIILVVFTFVMGIRIEYITNPMGGMFFLGIIPAILLVVFWMLILMNSVNWIDGIDGVSGGIALIGVITIFLLSLKPEVNQPPVGIITMALAGALLAFLVFNFNPARIFAGSSGSFFMGYSLGLLAIFAGTKIATTLMVMTIPILDFFWVIVERWRNKVSIFEADKRHLHFRLLELGWSQRQICALYYGLTIVIAVISLNTRAIGKIITISSLSILILFTLFIVERKSKLNEE